jgi:probable HAF family extracellular repeat protein
MALAAKEGPPMKRKLSTAAVLITVAAALAIAQPKSQPLTIIDLGTLGGSEANATGINDRGQVVGYSNTTTGAIHAFLWEDGTMTDLGTLPGGIQSQAYAINSRGQIVGGGSDASGDMRAVRWEDSTIVDLGTLPGGRLSQALAINNRGQVVGYNYYPLHAVLWTKK